MNNVFKISCHIPPALEASGKQLFFLYSYCFGKKLKLTHTHVCAVFVGFTPHIRSRVSDPVWYGPDPDPNSQDKPDSDPWIFFRPDPDPWIFLGRIRIQAKKNESGSETMMTVLCLLLGKSITSPSHPHMLRPSRQGLWEDQLLKSTFMIIQLLLE